MCDRKTTAASGEGHREDPVSDCSYDRFWNAFTCLTKTLEAGDFVIPHNHMIKNNEITGEPDQCPAGCVFDVLDIDQFVNRLITASWPADFALTESAAIDSTDVETWARRRSWAREPDVDPDHLPVAATRDGTDGDAERKNERDWPRLGHDGRLQHSLDADAREGYRSGKNMRRGDVFLGFDVHVASNVRQCGAVFAVPPILRGMKLNSAGSHKGNARVKLIDCITAAGKNIADVPNDRGYSYCRPMTWALQLLLRGIDNVVDLHLKQRDVSPGPANTFWIDGSLFSGLPSSLQRLPGIGPFMPREAKEKLRAKYDERAAYAFRPHAQPDKDGYQRFRGPALAKKSAALTIHRQCGFQTTDQPRAAYPVWAAPAERRSL